MFNKIKIYIYKNKDKWTFKVKCNYSRIDFCALSTELGKFTSRGSEDNFKYVIYVTFW